MKRTALLTVLFLFVFSASYAGLMTPELLMKLNRISEPKVSPDGKWIVYVQSTPDMTANSSASNIFVVTFDGKTTRQLTTNGKHNSEPVWSPDGDKLAFLSDRDGSMQAYILDMNGGEARRITDFPDGISNLGWSPDGKYFSFSRDIKTDKTLAEQQPDLSKANALVYDKLLIRHWDTWENEKHSHIFFMPINDTSKAVDIMTGEKFDSPVKPFGGREQIAWSPDGKEIAYVCNKTPNYTFNTNSDIYIYDIASKKTKDITDGMPGYDQDPLYSPDGKWIAFHSQERGGYESDRIRLMVFERATGKITELTKTLDQWVGEFVWAPDSKTIYLSAGGDNATEQLYSLSVPDGKLATVTEGDYNYGDQGLDISPDGRTLIFSKRNYNRPTEIYSMSTSKGEQKQVTDVNGEYYKNIDLAKIQGRWSTSTDGAKVFSWVVYPPDFNKNKKYPVIVYCQGGPQQAVNQFWSYGWNFLTMASKGYIVLAVNRRGVPGFGQAWVDAINRDYGGKPFEDIISATDDLAKESYVDKSRMAAIGGSAGGYMTFWIEGHNNDGRYKALVSHCGLFNLESEYGATEEMWFPNWDDGGPYWKKENTDYFMKNSPHRFVQDWKTPLLIITGELDYRVPYTQSLEAFTAAQSQGVPSKIVIYPKENHWVLHPQEQVLWYREVFNFLDKYCGNESSSK